MTATPGPVERVMARDTWIVLFSVLLIVLLAVVYTVQGFGMNMSALDMTRMAGPIGEPMPMGSLATWTWDYALLILLMWWIMMVAMMTPSAAPTLLLYAALKRHGTERDRATLLSLLFLKGYLLVWGGFSAFAASLQWATEQTGIINAPMMTLDSKVAAGAVLLLAGLYQFSSLKSSCLTKCSSPAQFLSQHRRKGRRGALLMGMHHGLYCLGCCWALMALLFVGGIMNLYWIVGLAIYVMVEKLVPYPRLFARVTGAALCLSGLWLLASGF